MFLLNMLFVLPPGRPLGDLCLVTFTMIHHHLECWSYVRGKESQECSAVPFAAMVSKASKGHGPIPHGWTRDSGNNNVTLE